ncbi:hypothetical protein M501DRAFT_776009 [Patellaria atrata CBS 101060]|uniref:F-box domain-containing protein n=1 Tax=Patellaria atrata CBS 101060 TaxID=1346257 RepID=A0A9P4SAT3_9PEZI|nr:hypothetical protein M501DRAFT_776009 [Patellaria atrata CBS 101060]
MYGEQSRDVKPEDIARIQRISRRFLHVSRDDNLWKRLCFKNSRAEVNRTRQHLLTHRLQPSLVALVNAVSTLSQDAPNNVNDSTAPNAEMQAHKAAARERQRALANWDPSYPSEKVNFYREYIHRHALISMNWFERMGSVEREGENQRYVTVTGLGVLYDNNGDIADKIFAPIEDGSVGVWDVRPDTGDSEDRRQGKLLYQSATRLLTQRSNGEVPELAESKAMMTETGAVECVSLDRAQGKGFFAVQNTLNQVDLNTLQLISRDTFPFPITALSESSHPTPLTIGTNMTLHLHDPRSPSSTSNPSLDVLCEIINSGSARQPNDFHRLLTGDLGQAYATLSQPGPLSILHLSPTPWTGNGEIWVGGRFTNILNYDRRYFPRVRGTIHSGARISAMTSLPHPYVPREMDLLRDAALSISEVRDVKNIPGSTLIAAGEYKGKGSLELYGLSDDPRYGILSTDATAGRNRNLYLQNRQTASGSKLLSVAPHGTLIVYSDGDGNIRWVERDGFTPTRSFNINVDAAETSFVLTNRGLFSGPREGSGAGDIVQKIVPTLANSTGGYTGSGDAWLENDDLVVWTGDGRLGLVGFNTRPRFLPEDFEERMEEDREKEDRAREEREFGAKMRRALERQADEVRFVRGLGMRMGMS